MSVDLSKVPAFVRVLFEVSASGGTIADVARRLGIKETSAASQKSQWSKLWAEMNEKLPEDKRVPFPELARKDGGGRPKRDLSAAFEFGRSMSVADKMALAKQRAEVRQHTREQEAVEA